MVLIARDIFSGKGAAEPEDTSGFTADLDSPPSTGNLTPLEGNIDGFDKEGRGGVVFFPKS